MNIDTAQTLVAAAQQAAREHGIQVSIAVVDPSGLLVAFVRTDGAFPGSVDVAVSKARTSALFPLPSGAFGELCREQKLDGMLSTNQGLVGFPGGYPVPGGGAIGVSGGTAAQDEAICREALTALPKT